MFLLATSLCMAIVSAPPAIDLSKLRVIDLSWPLDEQTLYWPTSPSSFELKQLSHGKTAGGFFYAANTFCAPEHGGTHLDAPIHFAEGGHTADQIPVERLLGPAFVIDVSAQAAKDRDYRLDPQDIAAFEKKNGKIPPGAIVILRTGWGKKYPNRKEYFGDDKKGDASNLHFPSYGKESAELLVGERKVAGLGVDTPSIDHGPSKDFIVHQIAAKQNVLGFENLARLEEIPETGAVVIALPMKIKGGSGGPARIIALLER